jgi:hypothetical protein
MFAYTSLSESSTLYQRRIVAHYRVDGKNLHPFFSLKLATYICKYLHHSIAFRKLGSTVTPQLIPERYLHQWTAYFNFSSLHF